MNTHRTVILKCLVVILFFGTAVVYADDMTPDQAKKIFDNRFGGEIAKATNSGTKKDDVALAETLLAAAWNTGEPALLSLMCRQSYELGKRNKNGYEIAAEALELLIAQIPANRPTCLEDILAMRQKSFSVTRGAAKTQAGENLLHAMLAVANLYARQGNPRKAERILQKSISIANNIRSGQKESIQQLLGNIKSRIAATRKAKSLSASLESKPGDIKTRKSLIQLYILKLDNPAAAAKLLVAEMDETMRSCIPLATRNPTKLPAEVAEEMARWYYSLAQSAPKADKGPLLARTSVYLKQFLAKYPKKDARQAAAEQQAKHINDELAKLGMLRSTKGWANSVDSLNLPTNAKITRAIRKAKKYLLSKQEENGRWLPGENPHNFNPKSTTLLVTCALIQYGIDPKLPTIKKILDSADNDQNRNTLYNAMSCIVFQAARGKLGKKYDNALRKRAEMLIKSTDDGSFRRYLNPDYPASNGSAYVTQWAVLAIAEADDAGVVKVPPGFWAKNLAWWKKNQNPDGGWGQWHGQRSRHFPTAAAAVSMLICMDKLGMSRHKALKNKAVRDALRWIDNRFDNGRNRDPLNYLYTIVRLGAARGTTRFGGKDWFKWLSKNMISRQSADGSWKPGGHSQTISTALGILVLDCGCSK
ncbi:MAG: hypothetical protein K8S55_08640 [Phycisphaerae bacterium]|nr:hypothetical protein [Phycisphaerae bacterium]